MGEPTHLSKLTIQEIRDEANEQRDRQICTVEFAAATNGGLGSSAFFVAQRKWRVAAIREIHGALGTDLGAVNVMVRKCTGVQAPAAGVALHTVAFDLKAAINTVQVGILTAILANLELAIGDRLAADFAGVLTAVAGFAIQVDLIPV